jgi:hypothetical protein
MTDLKKEFDALPEPAADPGDVAASRHVWLRARIASIVAEDRRSLRIERLRAASALTAIIAADAMVPILFSAAALPYLVTLTAIVVVHSAASFALLRS